MAPAVVDYSASVLPSGVSMLWESGDPHAALLNRFGFDGLTEATTWIEATLSRVWNLTILDCDRVLISSQNAIAWASSDRGDLVIKWSCAVSQFEGLGASAEVMGRLADRGVPVPTPIPSVVVEDRVVVDGPIGPLSVLVLPELDGTWLDVGEPATVRAAGACLARVHLALDGHGDPRLWRPSVVVPPDRRVQRWLADRDPALAPEATARLIEIVAALPPLNRSFQPVHNDFRAANILTREGRIVGILDFDEMAWDHTVSDLAKASVYLGTLFRNWRPTPPSARQELWAGYESVRPLTPLERGWLEAFTLWYAITAIPSSHDPTAWARAVGQ